MPAWNHFNPGYVHTVILINFVTFRVLEAVRFAGTLLGLPGGWCFCLFPSLSHTYIPYCKVSPTRIPSLSQKGEEEKKKVRKKER